MKKNIKIILLIVFILLILISFVLIFKEKLFPNTKDLICVTQYPGTENKDEFVFEFDNKGKIKSFMKKQINVYKTLEETQNQYKVYKESLENIDETVIVEYKDSKIEIEENSVIVYFYYDVLKDDVIYNKNRDEIKGIYAEGYNYSCEE